jgi:prophage regulatory protein
MLDHAGMQRIEPKQDELTKRHVDDLHRALRAKQAAQLLGVGVSTLWRYHANDPRFPRGRRLSARCTVFPIAELLAWRDSKVPIE